MKSEVYMGEKHVHYMPYTKNLATRIIQNSWNPV